MRRIPVAIGNSRNGFRIERLGPKRIQRSLAHCRLNRDQIGIDSEDETHIKITRNQRKS